MILGIVRNILFGVDTAIAVPTALLASLADPEAKLSYRISQLWAWFGVRICSSTVHVDGLERLDPNRSYVFMANHRSNFDVLALVEALWDFQLRWVAKEELAKIPFFGWALRATKHIIINRADHAQAVASLAAAERRMSSGISVVFFPEGTRGTGAMLPFKKGGFIFAIETKTPIVPIAISGSERVLPKGSWLVWQGGEVSVAVQPPIPTASASLEDRDALMAAVRNSIKSGLEELDAAPEPKRAPATEPAHGPRHPVGSPNGALPTGLRH